MKPKEKPLLNERCASNGPIILPKNNAGVTRSGDVARHQRRQLSENVNAWLNWDGVVSCDSGLFKGYGPSTRQTERGKQKQNSAGGADLRCPLSLWYIVFL